jgi:molybdenum cofactor biosynthesis protein MoaC
MINITSKSNTLRKAIASAIISVSKQETIEAIKNKNVPKGDVFEFSRAAGLLAIKKTSDIIPDCHPLPVEYTSITHKLDGLNIIISVEVHTVYKTGVEVEAMHGAAITALTMYDMLKPIDKAIEISRIKLESKQGGKTDLKGVTADDLLCAVLVCSDAASKNARQDKSGKTIVEKLKGLNLQVGKYEIIPDEFAIIQEKLKQLVNQNYNLVLFTGGTGLSSRDVTPEAIAPLIDREIPGIMEVARNYGQQRTPYAMLSRGVAGFSKNTLVITLPGSPAGVAETIDALFPHVLHVFQVVKDLAHE